MKPVQVYTTSYCGYCRRAKELLTSKGVAYQEIDVTDDRAARQDLVSLANGSTTVPQIFIGDHHVGGYTELAALDSAGKLDELLS